MDFLTGPALTVSTFVLALAVWLVCAGIIRFAYWFLRYLDRRDAAAFRAQVLLAEQEMLRRSRVPSSRAGEDTQ
jgi:hypothetical protein